MPPCPSPLVTVSLFSMSVSLFLFCKEVHLFHFLSVHIWLISYNICHPVWLHLVWSSLGPSMLLQMALFHSFSSFTEYLGGAQWCVLNCSVALTLAFGNAFSFPVVLTQWLKYSHGPSKLLRKPANVVELWETVSSAGVCASGHSCCSLSPLPALSLWESPPFLVSWLSTLAAL